jgi:predicted nucleic acid binding AN1-type Zn finger protein
MFNLATLANTITQPAAAAVAAAVAAATATATADTPVKKTINRCGCEGCKVRLLLTDTTCKCGTRFCSKHRFAGDHNCGFDYKAAAAVQLGAALVKVDGSKMERI